MYYIKACTQGLYLDTHSDIYIDSNISYLMYT